MDQIGNIDHLHIHSSFYLHLFSHMNGDVRRIVIERYIIIHDAPTNEFIRA